MRENEGLNVCGKILFCALLCLLMLPTRTRGDEGDLIFQQPQPIIIDQSSSASVTLQFRSGPAQTKVALSLGDFQSAATGEPQNAHVTFAALTDIAGKTVYKPADELPPNTTLYVRLDITNLREAGESTAVLYNDGKQIGTLKALKNQFPFAIHLLEGAPQDRPEVSFNPDQASVLILRNDDQMTYPIHWEVWIRGKSASGDDVVPAGSVAEIKIEKPPSEWFSPGVTGLLKPDAQDADILLSYRPPPGSAIKYPQQKALPIKARLNYFSASAQNVGRTCTVFIILFAGGILSLLASNWIPNQLRRRDLRERLDDIAKKTRDISSECDSALRVLIRVERRRLAELLESRSTVSPDMAGIFTQCEAGISNLDKRVTLLEDVDSIYDRLSQVRPSNPPPSLIKQILDSLQKATRLLKATELDDVDLQAVGAVISEVTFALDNIGLPDEKFAEFTANRLGELKIDFAEDGAVGKTEICRRIMQILPGPFEALDDRFSDPANITASSYTLIDEDLTILEQIKEYVLIHENSTDKDFLQTIEQQEGLLLKLWRQPAFGSLQEAHSLLMQIREGVSVDDLIAAIRSTPPAVSIKVDPPVVRTYQQVRWTARFNRAGFNGSAASEEISCVWDFGDGLRERGRSVTHYYPASRAHTVKLSFIDSTGQPVSSGEAPIEVLRKVNVLEDKNISRWDRSKTEIFRLFIMLFVALLGLMAGAQEQLLRLDIVPGLIAVFLLGFSADAIKNLITSRAGTS